MHSFEFRDFAPPHDGQTVLLDGCSGVVSLRLRRVDWVVVCTADAAVDAGTDGVTGGVDREDWGEDGLASFMGIREDVVPYLELTHGDYTTTGVNGGMERKTAFARYAAPNASRYVPATRISQRPLFIRLEIRVKTGFKNALVAWVIENFLHLTAE